MNKVLKSWIQLIFAALYFGAVSIPVYADDTEIYFTSNDVQNIVPNVVFIMDTSGSMSARVAGTDPAQDRLEVVQEALIQILNQSSNINVGLMRFSSTNGSVSDGGPVLYPARNLDAPATPDIRGRITQSSDDAFETTSSQAVNISSAEIDMITTPIPCSGCTYQQEIVGTSRNIEGGSLTFTWGSLGESILGYQFDNIDIPQGKLITDARIEFTVNRANQTKHNRDISLQVSIEDNINAQPFIGGTGWQGRLLRDEKVQWINLPVSSVDDKLITPNLRGLLQPLVDNALWNSGGTGASVMFRFDHVQGDGVRDTYSYSSGSSGSYPVLKITYGDQTEESVVGLRFTDINVPQGARITSAFLDFTAASSNAETANFVIYGEDSSDAATFTTDNGNISDRQVVGESVSWSANSWDTAGLNFQSVDISPVVEEIVANNDWCGGNAMAFRIEGNGVRSFLSYDAGSAVAPQLRVRFDPNSTTGCYTGEVVKRISNNNDDVELTSTDEVSYLSTDIDLYVDNSISASHNKAVGLIFRELNIPPNAEVLSAELEFDSFSNSNTSSGQTVISGVKDYEITSFPSNATDFNNLDTTSSQSTWSISPNWVLNNVYTSSDFTDVVQEIVNDGAWARNATMAFILRGSSGSYQAYSHDTSPAKAPVLKLRYRGSYNPSSTKVRNILINQVNDFTHTGYTPISGVLAEAALYYSGSQVHFGLERGSLNRNYFRVSHRDSYTGQDSVLPSGCPGSDSNAFACKDEYIPAGATYISPIELPCQSNHLVLLSDGFPNSNYSQTADLVQSITGQSCDTRWDGIECSEDVVRHIKNEDLIPSMPGDQTVSTHTIGFGFSPTSQAVIFLRELAELGGGEFYEASNSSDLVAAFENIIQSVLQTNTSFVSAGVSINQLNRLTNKDELYFALFRPDTSASWPGNLKKYKIADGRIVDSNGNEAINNVTGSFKDTAESFWDSLTTPGAADGSDVTKGGAANRLNTNTRTVYTNIDTSTGDLRQGTFGAGTNDLHEDNALITDTDLAVNQEVDPDAARTRILKWGRGLDVSQASPEPDRREYGDPLHSRPTVVSYKSGSEFNDVVFVATNEGYLHAVDSVTGDEKWSFVPKELLSRLKVFEGNAPNAAHAYGLDGSLFVYKEDLNNDLVIDHLAGEKAYLYVGMRRGGNSYYAFDISNISDPQLMFSITGGETANFENLGQSWSRPIVVPIRWGTGKRLVLVFGGGYDASVQDAEEQGPTQDGVGTTIFIVDALTGELIWDAKSKAGPSATPPSVYMTNSFPADVTAIDLTGSGVMEHLYAADMGGQVFRFDFETNPEVIVNESNLAKGYRIADLHSGTDVGTNRRFYYAPDISIIRRNNGNSFAAVSIGSGYRAHPLDTAVNEHFYVLRDEGLLSQTFDQTITLSNLVNVTERAGDGDAIQDEIEDPNDPKKGWYIDFSEVGEKVLARALTINGRVIFTTYLPAENSSIGACVPNEGSSRTYFVNVVDGTPAFDTNTDGVLDEDDSRFIDNSHGGIAPEPMILFTPDKGPVILVGTEVVCAGDNCNVLDDLIDTIKWQEQ